MLLLTRTSIHVIHKETFSIQEMNSKQEEKLLVFLFLNIYSSAKKRKQNQFTLIKHILLWGKALILGESRIQVKGGKFVQIYSFPLCILSGLPNKNDWGTEIFL